MRVHVFTFNPFQENTYVVYDESGECIIIDAGCYDKHEQETLVQWLVAEPTYSR
jgi:hydroxyacylglutathione hydrolase